MTSETNIIIDLEKHTDAFAFENENEIIQISGVKKCLSHIKDSLKKIENFKENLRNGCNYSSERSHNTISIFGSRGTGKTTFILNIFKIIKNQPNTLNDNCCNLLSKEDCSQIKLLNILDPTLIESKEHVFLNIISRIKTAVDKKNNEACRNECSNNNCEYTDWMQSLQKLAAGLHSIDGIGSNALARESWQDSIYVMEEGLKNVKASNELEKNFHIYVSKSLKFLNKKAFLIAFDDIDTDFTSGWPVLETIRKYLTTPQIITILSGDEYLYSKLIRKKQWENFGDLALKYEDYKKEDYKGLIDKLERQYLLKILKPQKRISLQKLSDLNTEDIKIRINSSEKDQKSLDDIIKDNLKKLWFLNSFDTNLYKKIILNEPIRTIIQVLIGLHKTTEPENNIDIQKSLVDAYLVTLQKFNFDYEFFYSTRNSLTLNKLAITLKENSLLDRGYRLKPEFQDIELNRLMLVLQYLYSNLINENKNLFFDYLIKIGLTHQVSLTNKKDLDSYFSYTGLDNGEDAVTIGRLFVGFLETYLKTSKNKSIAKGTIKIGGDSRQEIEKLYNDQEQKLSWKKYLMGLPFLYLTDANSTMYFSIFSILGYLGEALRCHTKDELKENFLSRSQIKYYEKPETDKPSGYNTEKDNENDVTTIPQENEINEQEVDDKFISAIQAWKKNDSENLGLPVHIYAKIFTRFYYSLTKIDETKPPQNNLKDSIHRFIITFLNSILLEESIYRNTEFKLNRNNPTGSDSIFNNNLKTSQILQEKSDDKESHDKKYNLSPQTKLEFFSWILTCPIWYCYIDKDSELFKAKSNQNSYIESINISEKLSLQIAKPYKPKKQRFVVADFRKSEKAQNFIQDQYNSGISLDECKDKFFQEYAKKENLEIPNRSIHHIEGDIYRIWKNLNIEKNKA